MNTLESYLTQTPYGTTEECARFVIDDILTPFVFHDITMVDQEYTFSFWLKADSDVNISVYDSEFAAMTEWFRHTVTFTADSVDLPLRFLQNGTYYMYHPNLEIGNMPSDYTPAPEDTDQKLENTSTSINQQITEQSATILNSAQEIILEATAEFVKNGDYEAFKTSVESSLMTMAGQITANFTTTSERTEEIDGELKTFTESFSKHIAFSGDNAVIIGGSSGILLTVDNDNGIIFSRIASSTSSSSGATNIVSTATTYQLHTSKTETPTGDWSTTLPSIPTGYHLWVRRIVTYDDGTTAMTDSVAFGSWDGNDFYTGNIIIRVDERAQFGNFAYVPRSDGSLSFLRVGE